LFLSSVNLLPFLFSLSWVPWIALFARRWLTSRRLRPPPRMIRAVIDLSADLGELGLDETKIWPIISSANVPAGLLSLRISARI
jgi:hypothetical protein